MPDWICEITSSSNVAHDRVTKAELYAGHSIPHFWLVDPAERTLESFELSGELWTRTGSYDESPVVRIKPFEEPSSRWARCFHPATNASDPRSST